jgi:hypothetical protein
MGKAEKVEKPTSKIRLRIYTPEHSVIIRNDRLPFIEDKTENAVKRLFDNGYKTEEIEIIGEKPLCWDKIFLPIVVEPTLAN